MPENISGFSRRASHFLRLAVETVVITNVLLLLSIGWDRDIGPVFDAGLRREIAMKVDLTCAE